MKALSAEEYWQHLSEMPKEERLCTLHYTLRNIPREFLGEYLDTPEIEIDRLFDEPLEGE